MGDTYTLYEHGIKHLLKSMDKKHARYLEIANLQTRMLECIRNLRTLGSDNPTERANLNQITPQLNEICLEVIDMNFNDWCDLVNKKDQELASSTSDPLRPYIGDWLALQNAHVNQQMMDELKEHGIRPKTNRKIVSEDPLARYKTVPLHARMLYTMQDPTMGTYILEQWASLDSQSSRMCDIYHSNDQFYNAEDAYDFINDSRLLKESGVRIRQTDLPGMFFWDHDEVGEFISFSQCASAAEITEILRLIFSELMETPNIEAIKKVKMSIELK